MSSRVSLLGVTPAQRNSSSTADARSSHFSRIGFTNPNYEHRYEFRNAIGEVGAPSSGYSQHNSCQLVRSYPRCTHRGIAAIRRSVHCHLQDPTKERIDGSPRQLGVRAGETSVQHEGLVAALLIRLRLPP